MAIDEKYIELINAEIDGELDESGQSELRDYLAKNPEARTAHDDMAAFCRELDSVPSLEPPSDLRSDILAAIRPTARVIRPDPGFWRQVVSMPMFRHAAAFAAGAFMTFALISSNRISDRAFDDVTGLVGTISDTDNSASALRSISLGRQDIAGTVSVHSAGSLTVVDFNLSTRNPLEIIAGFSTRDLWFRGFAQLENDDASVVADKGEVRMRMNGRNRYAIYLQQASRTPASIHLKFYSGGDLVHEADLDLAPATTGE